MPVKVSLRVMPGKNRLARPCVVGAIACLLGVLCAATGASMFSSWSRKFVSQWNRLPNRARRLDRVDHRGLFDLTVAHGPSAMSEDEQMWTKEYGPDGNYKFWSLGTPKVEIKNLAEDLICPQAGLVAVVLGCGLGVEVDYLARHIRSEEPARVSHIVAGVDIAAPAIDKAVQDYASTAGVVFYHADVCALPSPTTPLDLIIDNTVFQNMDSSQLQGYVDALRCISEPGHTVLHLNLMSEEGVNKRREFDECFEYLNLPLVSKSYILDALGRDWQLVEAREGLYDLKPEAAGFESEAFYDYGGRETPGIPSWWMMFVRKA